MKEFGVYGGIERLDANGQDGSVIGRCFLGSLRPGDRFTSIRQRSGESARLDLEIVKIEAYGRVMDEAFEGLTARISLRGSGWEAISDDSVLIAG